MYDINSHKDSSGVLPVVSITILFEVLKPINLPVSIFSLSLKLCIVPPSLERRAILSLILAWI
jgi:hypothetical protein